MRAIIFVGGIHGVGKTSFSAELSKTLKIPHLSAGDLINRHRPAVEVDKRVDDVNSNQQLLLRAIENLTTDGSKFTLDGHFCVLDSASAVQKISAAIFSSISPIAVIVLREDPQTICQRLLIRDGTRYSTPLLEEFQRIEIEYAHEVCASRGTPLKVFSPTEIGAATQFVKPLIDRTNS